jgi:hypothetical protein
VEAWQRSQLTDVTAKVVIYEAFFQGRLEIPKHLARTVHDLYFEPKYEEFRREPSGVYPIVHVCIERTGPHPPIQGYGQAGRIPGRPVLTIVLSLGALSAGPSPQVVQLALGDPCGRGTPAWAEERSYLHVSIVPTWANCGHARGASCIGESEATACLLRGPSCNVGTGANWSQPMSQRMSIAWLMGFGC